jgi:hypothetical protein
MNEDILNEQINNLQSISNVDINIKIRTLDNEFMVNINPYNKVEELKKRIENVFIQFLI